MTDPYRVLGVSPTASEEEIKKAYRKLSRLYHPDSNMNKSEYEKKQAEEKFKEVQTAYENIIDGKVDPRSYSRGPGSSYSSSGTAGRSYQGYRSGGGTYGGYTRSTSSGYADMDVHLEAAANFIANGYLNEARNILDNIDPSRRNARWYYYSAICYARTGNKAQAVYHARAAASMEPSNSEYSVLYDYLSGGPFTRSTQQGAASYTGWYNDRRNSYGYGSGTLNTGCTRCANSCMSIILCASCLGC
ncbi:MAG: DnaJ domain-containing protein [Lachnospiraceae bacterium]|nr:DnaJ domain-containing protein [Lachnospiraceae bacterium]